MLVLPHIKSIEGALNDIKHVSPKFLVPQKRNTLRSVTMRAGTSKGVFLRASDLPSDRSTWTSILPSIMGSPDPFGRQLDGLGGGTSTTSKLAVVSPSSAPDVADIDYLFIQCSIDSPNLDYTGNCGNILSGVGPFALEESLLDKKMLATLRPGIVEKVAVTLRCLNNGQLIRSTFEVLDGRPVEVGNMTIDGVSGSGSPIQLDFLEPAGSMCNSLLPTGRSRDELFIPGFDEPIEVSCVDAANPFVFVQLSSIDLTLRGDEPASVLAKLAPKVELIRQSAAVLMGLAPDTITASKTRGTPKICLVTDPLPGSNAHIHTRSFSMGQPHPALQLSGAVCLAAACYVSDSIPNRILINNSAVVPERLRLAHNCGAIETSADVVYDKTRPAGVEVRSASLFRTARRLACGDAYYFA